jgi:hypothetical protein
MKMSIEKYARNFLAIATDASIDGTTRVGRGLDLVWDAVATLQDDVGLLLGGLVRQDRWVFGALATAAERTHAGSGRGAWGDDPANAPLYLVPVVLVHERGTPLPRSLGLALPPLPDGRPVPGLVDFLLTWEELTQRFAATKALRETLAKVRADMAAADAIARLEKTFGPVAAKSAMDEFDSEEGRAFGLRFLPAWHLPGDAPWFATSDQRIAWQQAAAKAVDEASHAKVLPHPQAPSPFPIALETAEAIIFESALRMLAAESEKVRQGSPELARTPMALLFEPFGCPETGVAGTFRVSVIPAGDVSRPIAGIAFRVPVLREWAFWQDVAAKYAQIARDHFGTDSTVAPLVQEEDLLFRDQGARRLHITLGPPVSSGTPAPDGLAFDFPRSGDEAAHRWADRELSQVTNGLEDLTQALASSLGIGSGRIVTRASFALLKGVWRPVVTATLRETRKLTGEPLPTPMDASAVDAFKRSWEKRAARSWVEVAEAGVQA